MEKVECQSILERPPQDQTWCLQSPIVASGLLVPRIGPDTKLQKLARTFVHVDNYGVKFRDDAKSETFIKHLERAKYNIHRYTTINQTFDINI